MRTPLLGLALAASVASGACASASDLQHLPRLAAGSTRFLLVRHGQAFTNVPAGDSMPYEKADRLTDVGHTQARRTAAALAPLGVALLVSSPRGRTRETADELARRLPGVPRRTDDRLGPLREGRARDGRRLSWKDRAEDWERGRDPTPTDGESVAMLGARGIEALRALAPEMTGRTVVVVTHNEVVAALVAIAEGKPAVSAFPPKIEHASVTVVDCDSGGRLTVVRRNVVP